MISAISNRTLDLYIAATKKAAPKEQQKVLQDAVSEAARKENDLLEERIMRNNLLSHISFLKESDKEIFAQAIV